MSQFYRLTHHVNLMFSGRVQWPQPGAHFLSQPNDVKSITTCMANKTRIRKSNVKYSKLYSKHTKRKKEKAFHLQLTTKQFCLSCNHSSAAARLYSKRTLSLPVSTLACNFRSLFYGAALQLLGANRVVRLGQGMHWLNLQCHSPVYGASQQRSPCYVFDAVSPT